MAVKSGWATSSVMARKRRVLIVDDAESIRAYLADLLVLKGFEVDTAEDGRKGLQLLQSGAAPDVVLLDVLMPGSDGLDALKQMREFDAEVPIVMLSVVGTASTIVQAMQAGASDYLNKPFDDDELESTLMRVIARGERAPGRSRRQPAVEVGASVWRSEAMQRIRGVIDQIGDTDVTVLVQGESGVGKEIVARTIHSSSVRKDKPFVKVNCAALPEDLLESELFGYEPGAFTGANGRKPGRFELANKGTMFLDEIGEMSPGLQAKLLQVLQENRFTRLGGNEEIEVDVRVVCATHRPLLTMVADRSFREDLYFRLNVVNIEIPPLRNRRDEIPVMMETFLHRCAVEYEKPVPVPSARLEAAFASYDFPGNVRELENLIKRLVVLESEEPILCDLETGRRSRSGGEFEALLREVEATAGEVPLREVGRRVARQAERETISIALDKTQWNRKQAAKLLQVSYKTLLQKIRESGLDLEAP
ncbi:MAG: sigma-54 dependent transcriptional regulator [Myxococcota bacterium]|nr:sigma-54 dependent transcriptional regulator [Myxococcota bacterium]